MAVAGLEERAALLFALREKGVRDRAVLRAVEAVPRADFAPHRFSDLACRDVALPLPCGQTMAEPSLVARMLEGLAVEPSHRVLEVGSGSGYCTALLARLGREVLGVERFRSLARGGAARLSAAGVAGATVVWGDGLAVPPERGPFERILVHGVLPDGVPPELAALLAPGGAIVFARGQGGEQRAVRGRRGEDGAFALVPLARSRLRLLYDGPSLIL